MTLRLIKPVLTISLAIILGGCSSRPIQLSQQTDQQTRGHLAINGDGAYQRQLNDWQKAYFAYDKKAAQYWTAVAEKRKIRNTKRASGLRIALTDYVLSQPPIYNGPVKPILPVADAQKTFQHDIPSERDFVTASQRVFGYMPERPHDEMEFMRAYAIAAQQAGFTPNQLVSIFAFETGGNGSYDLQAGMLNRKSNTRPISTAIGYHQLVATASVSVMSEYGMQISRDLKNQAQFSDAKRRNKLLMKAKVVETMTAAAKSVPHQWSAQARLAKTPAGLGIHAMNLDKDVGPLLQIYKMKTSLDFLRRKGINYPVSGAELEMLNLTGDGNGFDMISMPIAYREKVPTANFFLRNGFERNAIAIKNNTVAKLLEATAQKMAVRVQKDGAQNLYQAFATNNLAQN